MSEINIAVVTRLQINVKVVTDQNRDNQFWFCLRYSQHKINRSTNFSKKIAISIKMTTWPWYLLLGSWKVKGHVATCKIKHMFVYVDNTNLTSILNGFQDFKYFLIFQLWPLRSGTLADHACHNSVISHYHKEHVYQIFIFCIKNCGCYLANKSTCGQTERHTDGQTDVTKGLILTKSQPSKSDNYKYVGISISNMLIYCTQ